MPLLRRYRVCLALLGLLVVMAVLGVYRLKGLTDQDQVILQGKDLVKPKQKVRTVPASTE